MVLNHDIFFVRRIANAACSSKGDCWLDLKKLKSVDSTLEHERFLHEMQLSVFS